jgi:hypothetical protein
MSRDFRVWVNNFLNEHPNLADCWRPATALCGCGQKCAAGICKVDGKEADPHKIGFLPAKRIFAYICDRSRSFKRPATDLQHVMDRQGLIADESALPGPCRAILNKIQSCPMPWCAQKIDRYLARAPGLCPTSMESGMPDKPVPAQALEINAAGKWGRPSSHPAFYENGAPLWSGEIIPHHRQPAAVDRIEFRAPHLTALPPW